MARRSRSNGGLIAIHVRQGKDGAEERKMDGEQEEKRKGKRKSRTPLDVYKGESWLVLEFVRRALPPRRGGDEGSFRRRRWLGWGGKDSCAHGVGNLLPRNHPAISMEREVVSTMAQAI